MEHPHGCQFHMTSTRHDCAVDCHRGTLLVQRQGHEGRWDVHNHAKKSV